MQNAVNLAERGIALAKSGTLLARIVADDDREVGVEVD